MTVRQRLLVALTGKAVDRLPSTLFYGVDPYSVGAPGRRAYALGDGFAL